jgi:hypothetical protein
MNEAVTVPTAIEQVSFSPAPPSDKVQLVSFAEKLVPDTFTVLPAAPVCESNVMDGVPGLTVKTA